MKQQKFFQDANKKLAKTILHEMYNELKYEFVS